PRSPIWARTSPIWTSRTLPSSGTPMPRASKRRSGPSARSKASSALPRMSLRIDHIAGGVFVAFGLIVFALSGDLPFGTLSFPGAGMMPKLAAGLLILFGLLLVVSARESAPLASVTWQDLPHAARVIAITAAAVALYQWLGFVITMALLLFTLIVVAER